jgi:hypothetical protein
MTDERFQGLTNDELADIWYALAGSDIRHPDCFKHLVDASIGELETRLGPAVRRFLDERFAKLRMTDVLDDVKANRKVTSECDPIVET